MHRILKSIGINRLLLIMGIGLLLPVSVWAGGKRQVNTQTADGIEIWQKEFDVSTLKPGRYNFIVRSKDAAGNEGVSGPFNIQVDPKAGLPVSRVVYPEANMVVRDNFNLIGVASGRYGLDQVYVRLDDAEYTPVEGKEYWSRRIDIGALSEGSHTIYARSVDSKGLDGPEYQVNFIIDKSPPSVELSSHSTGDIISGNQVLAGIADDPNGIARLSWSEDGKTWAPLSFKTKKGQTAVSFSFPLRAKNMEDGPRVFFIRAEDKTRLSITKPYLFFINNIPPVLEILTPDKNEDIYGQVQVTGRVIATVGLSKFFYEWAGDTQDIPLRPGDPFWSVTLPVSLGTNRNLPFRVTAVDKIGNTTTLTQRFQDNRKFKGPTIQIDYPAGNGLNSIAQDGSIYGRIAPGFYPAAISIEGEIEFLDARPGFRIPPEKIPQGRSTIRVWAVADDDTMGQPVIIRVNKPPLTAPRGQPLPVVNMAPSRITVRSPEQYAWFNSSVTVSGTINPNARQGANGDNAQGNTASDGFRLPAGTRIEYRLDPTEDWLPLTISPNGEFSANIGLSNMEEGPVHLEFRTVENDVENLPYYYPINKFSTRPQIEFITPDEKFGAAHGVITVTGIISGFVPLTEVSYSLDGSDYQPLNHVTKYGKTLFSYTCDYTTLQNTGKRLIIRAQDEAGSIVEQSPVFTFDDRTDHPITIVNTPLDNDVITGDMEISGIAYDDDGVAAIYWRVLSPENPWENVAFTAEKLDKDVPFNELLTAQSFQVPISFEILRDGENIIEVYAKDIYGVQGETIRHIIRVSAAAPTNVVAFPAIDLYNRRNITITGRAEDTNGVKQVFISMDNGNSYQATELVLAPEGLKPEAADIGNWQISLNTSAYNDGVYSLLIRSIDNYGIEAFSNALINIDNTPPEITLGAPNNGASAGMELAVTGQAYDGINLKGLSLQLVNINNASQQIAYEMKPDFVITEQIDVSQLSDGQYNLKLTAVDMAGNETAVTRDITLIKDETGSAVHLSNPMPGIDHAGPLQVSGTVTGAVIPARVELLLNNTRFAYADVDRYGVFRYDFPEDRFTREETLLLSAAYDTPTGKRIASFEHEVKISPFGPLIEVESHKDGDVITQRPWLSGRAFVSMSEDEAQGMKLKQKAAIALKNMQISFDNGRSFNTITRRSGASWRYRLETGDLAAGPLPILLKAQFADGRYAVRRIVLTVDTASPSVVTIGPAENSTHRDNVLVYGSADDDFSMDTVEVSLRPGDKAGYAVPQFIQGLYLDASVLGGTTWSTGLGLAFFDNNVKLQVQFGQAPPGGRYSGNVFGAKLIANVANVPFDYFFGPDWAFFSMTFGVGANFSWFTMEEGEQPLMMSAVLAQWEFARVDLSYAFEKWKYMKTVSLYVEPILWFAPSDVSGDEVARAVFRLTFGARISLF
ncbi:hypothetical protein AGMMS50293_26840 [Spirochaetia bacterium]|nr:hypothetical protein AGMMS50293_26840 [Spirochaetia bacterium]